VLFIVPYSRRPNNSFSLDQINMKVMMSINADSGGKPFHWALLEDILASFLEMIEQKRILADSTVKEYAVYEEPRNTK
jgi:hypothetical protein